MPPRSHVSNLENSSICASKVLDLLSPRLPMVNSTENIRGSPENSKCFSRTRELEKIYAKMIEISNRLIIKFLLTIAMSLWMLDRQGPWCGRFQYSFGIVECGWRLQDAGDTQSVNTFEAFQGTLRLSNPQVRR